MIIIDFYNLVTGQIRTICKEERCEPTLDIVRTISINSILYNIQKQKQYHDDVVIAFDTKKNWRTTVFPNYKLNRLKQRKDDFDYSLFYESLEAIKIELKSVMPYKCIEVEGAEADDIISIVARGFATKYGNVCIVSSDKDFVHLQELKLNHKIVQYSPFKGTYIDESSLDLDLDAHIVGGDSSDGIPNIFSDDDVFLVDGKRQKPFTKNKKAELAAIGLDKFYELQDDITRQRIDRNIKLIDLTKIPHDIAMNILQSWVNAKENFGMLNQYLIQHRMNVVLERFGGMVL